MTFVIPDPRWEEPNLLIPGKKPTGPVVIDLSHKYGASWNGSIINGESIGRGPMEANSGASMTAGAFDSSGATAYHYNSNTISPPAVPFTVIYKFMVLTAGQWNRIAYLGISPNYVGTQLQVSSGNNIYITLGDGTGYDSGTDQRSIVSNLSVSANTWYTVAFTWYPSGGTFAGRLSINGKTEGFTYSGATISTYDGGADNYDSLGRLEFISPGNYYYSDNLVEFVHALNRESSQGELNDLTRDSHQFLLPG